MKNQSKDKLEMIVNSVLERMIEDSTLRLFIAKMCFDYYEESKFVMAVWIVVYYGNLPECVFG